MSTTTQRHQDLRVERTLRAVVRTQSGSTYRLDGDRVVLDGPGEQPFQEFTDDLSANKQVIKSRGAADKYS